MRDKAAARRYAEGFLDFAKETIGLEKGFNELALTVQTIAANPELKKLLASAEISEPQKYEVVDNVFAKDISEQTREFFKLLIHKKRVEEIYDIADHAKALFWQARGIEKVLITSATKLNKETIGIIKDKLEKKSGKRLELEAHIDPGLIGGIRAQIGNLVIDGSVKRKLAQLKEYLTEIEVG